MESLSFHLINCHILVPVGSYNLSENQDTTEGQMYIILSHKTIIAFSFQIQTVFWMKEVILLSEGSVGCRGVHLSFSFYFISFHF